MKDDSNPTNLDPNWFKISRFRPEEPQFVSDVERLKELLKNPNWHVRWNAARELYFLSDPQTLDVLLDLFKNDPVDSVRRMAAQALGALHEKGVVVPGYQDMDSPPEQVRVKVALARLAELGVKITREKDFYRLLIPHELLTPYYIEIGYLMAQLVDLPFPQEYAPLTEVPSSVIPHRRKPNVEFRESYPHGLKYFVYRWHK